MKLLSAAVMAGLASGLMSGAAQSAVIYSSSAPGFGYFDIGLGTYSITATGAAGGGSSNVSSGGYGAVVTGTFTFARSTRLTFLIGGHGDPADNAAAGGGAGHSSPRQAVYCF